MGPGRFGINIGCVAAVLAVPGIMIPGTILSVSYGDGMALVPLIQFVALLLGLVVGIMAAWGRRTGRW